MASISDSMTPAYGIRRKNSDFSSEKIVYTLDEQGNYLHAQNARAEPRHDPRGGYYPYKFDGGVKGITRAGMLMDVSA